MSTKGEDKFDEFMIPMMQVMGFINDLGKTDQEIELLHELFEELVMRYKELVEEE